VTGLYVYGLLPPLCCICVSLSGQRCLVFRQLHDHLGWRALRALPVGSFGVVLACDGLPVPKSSLSGEGKALGYTQR
jgi:hypothetical protein